MLNDVFKSLFGASDSVGHREISFFCGFGFNFSKHMLNQLKLGLIGAAIGEKLLTFGLSLALFLIADNLLFIFMHTFQLVVSISEVDQVVFGVIR